MQNFFLFLLFLCLGLSCGGAQELGTLSSVELDLEKLRTNFDEIVRRAENNLESYEATVERVLNKLRSEFGNNETEDFTELEWFAPVGDSSYKKLRVCIVCSSFEGLYQNSGIGTFSTALARFLADEGHSVTVYYTNDQPVESYSFQYWVDYYSDWNIDLVPQIETRQSLKVSAPAFQRRSYATYQFLKEHTFDVVHFPDFEGLGYYSLLAKQEGLAFDSTQMIVGLHGPTRWVREENRETLHDTVGLEVDYMEQRSIELADVLWTPSNHLLRWVTRQGWHVPSQVVLMPLLPGRDVMDTAVEEDEEEIQEVVFFGRLEERKGLYLFCDALDVLAQKEGVEDLRVTFLGRSVALEGGFDDSLSYVLRRAGTWPFAVRVLGHLPHRSALEYLQGPGRMSVITSVGDNAPYTFAEVLWLHLPVTALHSPSLLPLVHPEDREKLVPSRVEDLAAALATRLHSPPVRLRPVEAVEKAEEMWRRFYYSLPLLPRQPVEEPVEEPEGLVSVVVTHYNRPGLLDQALASIRNQTYPWVEVILVDDASTDPAAIQYLLSLEQEFSEKQWTILRVPHGYLGAARNRGAAAAKGQWVLFLDDDNILHPEALSTYRKAAVHSNYELLTAAHEVFGGTLPPSPASLQHRWLPLGPSVAVGLFKNCFGDANFFVNRAMFLAEGGFTEEVGVGLEDHEFHAKVALHRRRVGVVPESLLYYRMHDPSGQMLYATDPLANRLRYSRVYSEALQSQEEVLTVLATSQWAVRQVQCENSTLSEISPEVAEVTNSQDILTFTITGDGLGPYENCEGALSASIGGVTCQSLEYMEETESLECTWSVSSALELFGNSPLFNAPLDVSVTFPGGGNPVLFAAVVLLDRRPRVIVQARLVSAANGVRVIFDGPTNQGGMTGNTMGCGGLIATSGGLGTGYACVWPNNTQVVITFGSGATLVPGDSLTLASGVLTPPLAGLTVTVDPPLTPPRLDLRLTGPTVQGACDGGTYALSLAGRAGRPLTSLSWALTPPIARQLSLAEGEVLVLGPEELTQGQSYVLSVSGTNWLGSTAETSVTILKGSGDATPPRVTMPPPQRVEAAARVFLTATIRPSACAPTGTRITSQWTVSPAVSLGPTAQTPALVIPPRTLAGGTEYTFEYTATATSSVGVHSTVASVSVTVESSPLEARLLGGDFTVGLLAPTFVLDASPSRDPDSPSAPLTYVWTCQRVGSAVSTCPVSPGNVVRPSIQTNQLEVGAYDFSVTVTRDSRSATSTPVRVTVVAGDPPNVRVQSVPLHTASEKLTLTGTSVGTTPVASWQWSVVEGGNVLAEAANILSSLTSRVLVLRPNALTPGATYRFQLRATGTNNQVALAFATVQVNSPPCCGSLTISPSSGTALSTVFTVTASDWVDEGDLLYTFFAVTPRGSRRQVGSSVRRSLSERSPLSRLEIRLPVATSLVVVVTDPQGASSELSTPVTVSLPEATFVEVYEEGLALMEEEGDDSALGSLIQTVLSMAQGTSDVVALSEVKEDMALRTLEQARLELTPERVESILLSLAQLCGSRPYTVNLLLTLGDMLEEVTEAAEAGELRQEFLSRFVEAFFLISSRLGQTESAFTPAVAANLLTTLADLQNRIIRLQLNSISPGEAPLDVEVDGGTLTLAKSDVSDLQDKDLGGNSWDTIFIPSTVGDALPNTTSEVSMGAFQYDENPYENTVNGSLFSDVMELNLYDENGEKLSISGLDPPLIFEFIFSSPLDEEAQQLATCSFLDEETNEWSAEGCEVRGVNATWIQCACTHLSVFVISESEADAAATDPQGGDDGPGDTEFPSWVWIVVGVVGGVLVVTTLIIASAMVYRRRSSGNAVGPAPPIQNKKEGEREPTGARGMQEEHAAIKIQSLWRGYSTRKAVPVSRSPKRSSPSHSPPQRSPKHSPPVEKLPSISAPHEIWKEEVREPEEKKQVPKKEHKKSKEKPAKVVQDAQPSQTPASPVVPASPAKPRYGPREEKAAIKIQRVYRKHLATQDIQREEEIEQLLLDIDELLSADLM